MLALLADVEAGHRAVVAHHAGPDLTGLALVVAPLALKNCSRCVADAAELTTWATVMVSPTFTPDVAGVYTATLSNPVAIPADGGDPAEGRIVYNFSGSECEGYTTDFRQLYATVAREWWGVNPEAVVRGRFEPPRFRRHGGVRPAVPRHCD